MNGAYHFLDNPIINSVGKLDFSLYEDFAPFI